MLPLTVGALPVPQPLVQQVVQAGQGGTEGFAATRFQLQGPAQRDTSDIKATAATAVAVCGSIHTVCGLSHRRTACAWHGGLWRCVHVCVVFSGAAASIPVAVSWSKT
jgi:hypothetical protein